MANTTAAIVWGIPVEPADLLCNLDAFRKAAPTIHTLRLCNQFGKGENAGIIKLPKELIEFIGDEILTSSRQEETRAGHEWAKKYRCFEGTCCPRDHLDKEHQMPYCDAQVQDAEMGLFEDHPEWQTEDGLKLPENYDDLLEEAMAEELDMYAGDYYWEVCSDNKFSWQYNLRKHMENDGNSDVLRKHFGLDTFFMYENLDTSTIQYLERTDTRYSFGGSETQKATICYLILPSQTAKWDTRLDDSIGDYYGESANSMLVDRSSLDLSEEHQRRFARAMLRLALKPSVHPSQLQKNLSATSTLGKLPSPKQAPISATDKKVSKKENAKRDAVTTSRINNLEQSQWPKLMLLASQTVSE
ncbi:hypothetical protein E4T50_10658 [Aureobasidium sp. EXF-12298]|nr:hypothetical protein E4T50_10658 [Aureobasidium sp. EXF-12298]